MSYLLETGYRGADLSLEIVYPSSVILRINGLARDKVQGDVRNVVLRVSSTVQTDYEWHEFIEGIVEYHCGTITARLVANNQELVNRQYTPRDPSP